MGSEARLRRGEPRALRRQLSLWSVTMTAVGVILGAGVYALVGPVAGEAGGAIWLAFAVAAVIAGLTAHSYARFAAIVPKNSPEFQYASLAFGARVGFAAGWMMVWADVISVAAVALGFGGYLAHLLPVPLVLGALLLIGVSSLVAVRGIGESVGVAVAFTFVELGGLLFIIAVGLPSWGRVDYLEMPKGVGGVWTAAALIFFAYLGFDELGNFAEETRTPERTLPRALLIAMVISTLVYLGVSVSAVSALGWRELSASSAPLAAVAGKVLGSRADQVLTLVALAATANTVLLLIVSGSRSLHGMASARVLPSRLTAIGRWHTPWAAILLAGLLGAAFALVGNLERVAQMTNAAVLLSFAVVNLGLFWHTIRRRQGRPLGRILADTLPPLAATGLCLWLLFFTGLEALLLALLLGGVGLVIAYVVQRRLTAPSASQ